MRHKARMGLNFQSMESQSTALIVQRQIITVLGASLKKIGFTAAAAKDLVANTRAQAQAEAEQAAQHAAANTATEVELEHPNDISEPINQSMHFQDMQDGPQTQASTTLLSQMLSQVCVLQPLMNLNYC